MVRLGSRDAPRTPGFVPRPHRLVPHLRPLGRRAAQLYALLEAIVMIILVGLTLIATGATTRSRRRPAPYATPRPWPVARPFYFAGSVVAAWVAFWGLLSWSVTLVLEASIIAGIFTHAAFREPRATLAGRLVARRARPVAAVLVLAALLTGGLAAYGTRELQEESSFAVTVAPRDEAALTALIVTLQADGQPARTLRLDGPVEVLLPFAFEKRDHEVRVTVQGGPTHILHLEGDRAHRILVGPDGVEAVPAAAP